MYVEISPGTFIGKAFSFESHFLPALRTGGNRHGHHSIEGGHFNFSPQRCFPGRNIHGGVDVFSINFEERVLFKFDFQEEIAVRHTVHANFALPAQTNLHALGGASGDFDLIAFLFPASGGKVQIAGCPMVGIGKVNGNFNFEVFAFLWRWLVLISKGIKTIALTTEAGSAKEGFKKVREVVTTKTTCIAGPTKSRKRIATAPAAIATKALKGIARLPIGS